MDKKEILNGLSHLIHTVKKATILMQDEKYIEVAFNLGSLGQWANQMVDLLEDDKIND